MDIFRFARWFWNKRDTVDKITIIIFSSLFFILVSSLIFGPKAFIIYLSIVLISMLLYIVYQGIIELKKQYSIFKQEKEKDADRIIRSLKGSC